MINSSTAAERFIHTNMLARQHITKTDAGAARGFFVCTVCMILLLMLSFLLFLWVRLYIFDIGYQISSAHAVHEKLVEENAQLRIERASLRVPSRIEHIAQQKLGMVLPRSNQVIVLQW